MRDIITLYLIISIFITIYISGWCYNKNTIIHWLKPLPAIYLYYKSGRSEFIWAGFGDYWLNYDGSSEFYLGLICFTKFHATLISKRLSNHITIAMILVVLAEMMMIERQILSIIIYTGIIIYGGYRKISKGWCKRTKREGLKVLSIIWMITSDAILAYNKYIENIALECYVVILSYWIGLLILYLGRRSFKEKEKNEIKK